MSNIVLSLAQTTFNVQTTTNSQTSIAIQNTAIDLSFNTATNTQTVIVTGSPNGVINIPIAQVSFTYDNIGLQYSFNIVPVSGPAFVANGLPFLTFNIAPTIVNANAPFFSLATVPSGGARYPQSPPFQPNNAMTILASFQANSNNTNYPALVSYGLDDSSPFESYILQAQSTDGNHPIDFYMVTANTSNANTGNGHQVFGTTKIQPNTFYSVAVTFNGNQIILYVNGAQDKVGNVSGNVFYPAGSNNGLGIGTKYTDTTYGLSGTVSNVACYSYAWTANQILAYYNSEIGNTGGVTGYAALSPVFPRKGLMGIGGGQSLANNNALVKMGKFDVIVIGGVWEGWANTGRVKHNCIANIKFNSVTSNGTIVFSYIDLNELYVPSPLTGSSITPNVNDGKVVYTREVAKNNWWLYTVGSSGSTLNAGFGPLVNYAGNTASGVNTAFAGTNASGETPYQFGAKYAFNLVLNENKTDGRFTIINNNVAANNQDGLYLDNLLREPFVTADWMRAGSSQADGGSIDGKTANNLSNGQAQFYNTLQATANTAGATIMSFGNMGDYGRSVTANLGPMNQVLHGGFCEAYIGETNSTENTAGYLVMQQQYARALAITQPPKLVLFAGYIPDAGGLPANSPWMWARYIIASALMQDGYGCVNYKSNGYAADTIAQIAWFDEWDNSGSAQGFLGRPIAGPAGAAQTGANTNGVWIREFTGGIVLANPYQNGAKTITTAMLGGSNVFRFIAGTQDAANNTGANVHASFTLAERDGRVLIRN